MALLTVQRRVDGLPVAAAPRPAPAWGIAALAVLVAAGAATYLVNRTAFPLNNDEAIYILYSYVAAHAHRLSDLFGAFDYAVPPLFMWLGALALRLQPDPAAQPATIRVISALSGLGTIVGVYVLAWRLFRDARISSLAALLYTFCPYAVMFNRIGMLDALVQFLGILVAIQSVHVSTRAPESRRAAALLGVLLALGNLAKGIGAFFWLLPLLCWLTIEPDRQWRRLGRRALVATPIATALYAVILASGNVRNLFRPFFTAIKYSFASSPVHFNADSDPFPLWSYVVHNAQQWISWQQNYVGLGLTAILALGAVFVLYAGSPSDRLLALWLAMPLALMLLTKVYDSRYVVFTVPIEALAISRTIWVAVDRLRAAGPRSIKAPRPGSRLVRAAALGTLAPALLAVTVYAAHFDYTHDVKLVTDPVNASYDTFDRWYYISGWVSGYGIDNVAAYIRNQARDRHVTVVVANRFLPLVYLDYSLANDPHVQLAPAPTDYMLPSIPARVSPHDLYLAAFDLPKDTALLAALRAARPRWRVVLTQSKPGGLSQFIVLSSA